MSLGSRGEGSYGKSCERKKRVQCGAIAVPGRLSCEKVNPYPRNAVRYDSDATLICSVPKGDGVTLVERSAAEFLADGETPVFVRFDGDEACYALSPDAAWINDGGLCAGRVIPNDELETIYVNRHVGFVAESYTKLSGTSRPAGHARLDWVKLEGDSTWHQVAQRAYGLTADAGWEMFGPGTVEALGVGSLSGNLDETISRMSAFEDGEACDPGLHVAVLEALFQADIDELVENRETAVALFGALAPGLRVLMFSEDLRTNNTEDEKRAYMGFWLDALREINSISGIA